MADFQHENPHEQPGLGSTMGLLSTLVNQTLKGATLTRANELIREFQRIYEEQCEITGKLEEQLANQAKSLIIYEDNDKYAKEQLAAANARIKELEKKVDDAHNQAMEDGEY
jgi:polyhydroxyalkanoate synthesis regulator phasin